MGLSLEIGGGEKLYRRGARNLKVLRFAVGEADLKFCGDTVDCPIFSSAGSW